MVALNTPISKWYEDRLTSVTEEYQLFLQSFCDAGLNRLVAGILAAGAY